MTVDVDRVGVPRLPTVQGRNPFAGKGLAVTVALLLHGERPQSVADLAERAEASRPLASQVVRRLRQLGLVVGDLSQGREGRLRPTADLLLEAGRHWPGPVASVIGGRPPVDAVPVGGGLALRRWIDTAWEAPPRLYVRRLDDAPGLLADAGGFLVSGGESDWEIAVVDFPFTAGPVPGLVSALELAATPRGREVLAPHLTDLTNSWNAE